MSASKSRKTSRHRSDVAQSRVANAAQEVVNGGYPQFAGQQIATMQTTSTVIHQGPIPQFELIEGYERVLPGATDRILSHAEREQKHRHQLEAQAQSANEEAQRKQIDILEKQTRNVFLSDTLSQLAGSIALYAMVAAAFYFGFKGDTITAAIFVAPQVVATLAGLIQRSGKKPNEKS